MLAENLQLFRLDLLLLIIFYTSVRWEKGVAKFEQKLLNSQNLFCKL